MVAFCIFSSAKSAVRFLCVKYIVLFCLSFHFSEKVFPLTKELFCIFNLPHTCSNGWCGEHLSKIFHLIIIVNMVLPIMYLSCKPVVAKSSLQGMTHLKQAFHLRMKYSHLSHVSLPDYRVRQNSMRSPACKWET